MAALELASCRRATLDWLASYSFSGSIAGYREGEVYFPGSPILIVEASFAEGVILETLALSILNYDSAVASAAARMVAAADGRPLAEMGSRRVGERSAVAAARAAYIAGFAATSNLEAGRTWGVPTMGTAAHAFTLLHDSEEEAFRAQVDAMGVGTTLLVDTYDIAAGIETAVRVAGTSLGAIRIDSGDLPTVVAAARDQLDALGATETRITVTNDLDEYTLAALRAAPVDSYGVGTSVVTGSGSPASGMVYKLVAHQSDAGDWIPVGKLSDGKATVAGRKVAVRSLDHGVAVEETVYVEEPESLPKPGRGLLVDLVTDGVIDPSSPRRRAGWPRPASTTPPRSRNSPSWRSVSHGATPSSRPSTSDGRCLAPHLRRCEPLEFIRAMCTDQRFGSAPLSTDESRRTVHPARLEAGYGPARRRRRGCSNRSSSSPRIRSHSMSWMTLVAPNIARMLGWQTDDGSPWYSNPNRALRPGKVDVDTQPGIAEFSRRFGDPAVAIRSTRRERLRA